MNRRWLALLLGLLFSACSARDGYFITMGNDLFPRSTWRLVELSGPKTRPPIKKTTMWIDGPEQISGTAGCNRYAGRFSTSPPSQVNVLVYTVTKDICDDDIMADEQLYLLNLSSAKEYQVIDNQLYLLTNRGKTALIFKRD